MLLHKFGAVVREIFSVFIDDFEFPMKLGELFHHICSRIPTQHITLLDASLGSFRSRQAGSWETTADELFTGKSLGNGTF
jgi:hypothetical protein